MPQDYVSEIEQDFDRCAIEHVIPGTHPVLSGHFPGNPVVPAVMILDRVRNAYATWRAHASMIRISKVKFVSVLRPDERFSIELRKVSGRYCVFTCKKLTGERFAFGEFTTGQEIHGS